MRLRSRCFLWAVVTYSWFFAGIVCSAMVFYDAPMSALALRVGFFLVMPGLALGASAALRRWPFVIRIATSFLLVYAAGIGVELASGWLESNLDAIGYWENHFSGFLVYLIAYVFPAVVLTDAAARCSVPAGSA